MLATMLLFAKPPEGRAWEPIPALTDEFTGATLGFCYTIRARRVYKSLEGIRPFDEHGVVGDG